MFRPEPGRRRVGDGAMKRWLGSARIMPVKIETRVGWCNERMAGAAQAAVFCV